MSNFESLERAFRNLHSEFVESYEEGIKLRREQEARFAETGRRGRSEQDDLRRLQLSQEEVDRMIEADRAELKEYLDKVRPPLINRPPQSHLDAKRRAFLNSLEIPGSKRATVYATSLVSSDPQDLSHVKGERGNPWVLPWNPDEINISRRVEDTSLGLCGWARAAISDKTAVVYFGFQADKTAVWNLLALFDFHGFYQLRLNFHPLLCRFSEVSLDASMNVYQYFWNGEKPFHIIHRRKDSLSRSYVEYANYDDYQQFDYQVQLRAERDWWVIAQVVIRLRVDAYGSGSAAELNFEDGSANYIKPLALLAWPLSA